MRLFLFPRSIQVQGQCMFTLCVASVLVVKTRHIGYICRTISYCIKSCAGAYNLPRYRTISCTQYCEICDLWHSLGCCPMTSVSNINSEIAPSPCALNR